MDEHLAELIQAAQELTRQLADVQRQIEVHVLGVEGEFIGVDGDTNDDCLKRAYSELA